VANFGAGSMMREATMASTKSRSRLQLSGTSV